jgi:hypothetical protein
MDQFTESANRWIRDRHMLLSHVQGIAGLSGVDGSTVFDQDLQLLGIGGKIGLANKPDDKPLIDSLTNQNLDKEVMMKMGMRHLSAYQLCQAHDGISCYVVSQDGPVTALWSHQGIINRWTPFWAWAKKSDHI